MVWAAAAVALFLLTGLATGPPWIAGGDAPTGATTNSGSDGCEGPCPGFSLQFLPDGAVSGQWATSTFDIIAPGFGGAEPTLGVTDDGQTLYIQYGLNTARSLDGGATWAQIAPPLLQVTTADPMLYYDPVLDRLYVQHLTIECSILGWTDTPATVPANPGPTDPGWTINPHACGMPVIDHPKLEGGPSPTLGALNGDRALYMAYDQPGTGAIVAKSLDGGLTWLHVIATSQVERGGTPIFWPTGPVTADPNGPYVYLPHHNGAKGLMLAYSHDEGLTYTTTTIMPGPAGSDHILDPEVGVDDVGNAYVVWYNRTDHQVYMNHSADHGVTWSSGIRLSNASQTLSTVFPAAVANDTGRLNIAYLGTPNSTAGPDGCATSGPSKCVWYLYMTQITDAHTASPNITTTQITPDTDPVQIGKVCTQGAFCPAGTRGLLDFIDIKIDGNGTAHIVYADGCGGSCTPAWTGQSTGAAGRYARQSAGPTI